MCRWNCSFPTGLFRGSDAFRRILPGIDPMDEPGQGPCSSAWVPYRVMQYEACTVCLSKWRTRAFSAVSVHYLVDVSEKKHKIKSVKSGTDYTRTCVQSTPMM